MAQILVVDDEIGIRELLFEILSEEGHEVLLAENAAAARGIRERQRPDLILLDIWMPDIDGVTLLKEWAANGRLNLPIVMMSGHGTIETAVEATRIGALDFLEKPIALQRLLATVQRALRNEDNAAARGFSLAAVGRSAVLADAKRRIAQLAQSSGPLMFRGERGMRPELFARLLAQPSAPFVTATDFLAEAAPELPQRVAGGILFFPDLTRMSRAEQRSAALLRAQAERQKVRIVSFSTVDSRTLAANHDFDPELAQRLAELTFMLPPLREFADDVPDIAAMMLAQFVEGRVCAPRRLSTAALNALRQQPWLGNLDELESIVRELALTSLDETIELDDVSRILQARAAPSALSNGLLDQPYRAAREIFERMYFDHLLVREKGSVARVAEHSGLERTHLYRKLKALGLSAGRRDED